MMGQKKDALYHRRSIRLKEYDYSGEGGYFITLVTHQRECIFGDIIDGEMRLNSFGRIVREEWFKIKDLRADVELIEEEFIVMPNHIHGIIWLFLNQTPDEKDIDCEPDDSRLVVDSSGKGTARRALTREVFGQPRQGSLSTIVGAFKSAVTKQINLVRNTPSAKVWQRNYYEHIIFTEKEYDNIVNYIYFNSIPKTGAARTSIIDRENGIELLKRHSMPGSKYGST